MTKFICNKCHSYIPLKSQLNCPNCGSSVDYWKQPQTAEQIEQEFTRELQELLDRYEAELEARDHWTGYAECGEDVRMTVSIPAIYDPEGEVLREGVEVDLGQTVSPTPKS